MDTIYCFKFNDITGEITKIEIPQYRIIYNKWNKRNTYAWDSPRINKSDTYFSVPDKKMDRFVSNKVFTFKNDYEHAYKVIRDTLLNDADDLEKRLLHKYKLLNLLTNRGYMGD